MISLKLWYLARSPTINYYGKMSYSFRISQVFQWCQHRRYIADISNWGSSAILWRKLMLSQLQYFPFTHVVYWWERNSRLPNHRVIYTEIWNGRFENTSITSRVGNIIPRPTLWDFKLIDPVWMLEADASGTSPENVYAFRFIYS